MLNRVREMDYFAETIQARTLKIVDYVAGMLMNPPWKYYIFPNNILGVTVSLATQIDCYTPIKSKKKKY